MDARTLLRFRSHHLFFSATFLGRGGEILGVIAHLVLFSSLDRLRLKDDSEIERETCGSRGLRKHRQKHIGYDCTM